MQTSGILYVVATPIGNLKDITLRAIEVLKSCDLILSEDTRETKKLLDNLGIQKEQISYRDQNHNQVFDKIVEFLNSGSSLALVSDSGTPLISDPGFKLVSQLRAKKYKIEVIPGASAVTSAISVSGLPTDKFSFLGFLPKKSGQRQEILKTYGELDSTLIIYESPFRVKKLLEEIDAALGDRLICICRELTKVYEEVITGYTKELLATNIKTKGEFTILVAKSGYKHE